MKVLFVSLLLFVSYRAEAAEVAWVKSYQSCLSALGQLPMMSMYVTNYLKFGSDSTKAKFADAEVVLGKNGSTGGYWILAGGAAYFVEGKTLVADPAPKGLEAWGIANKRRFERIVEIPGAEPFLLSFSVYEGGRLPTVDLHGMSVARERERSLGKNFERVSAKNLATDALRTDLAKVVTAGLQTVGSIRNMQLGAGVPPQDLISVGALEGALQTCKTSLASEGSIVRDEVSKAFESLSGSSGSPLQKKALKSGATET